MVRALFFVSNTALEKDLQQLLVSLSSFALLRTSSFHEGNLAGRFYFCWLEYIIIGWVEDFSFYSNLLSFLFNLSTIPATNGLAFYPSFMVYSHNL
jgi:hypothetical protein